MKTAWLLEVPGFIPTYLTRRGVDFVLTYNPNKAIQYEYRENAEDGAAYYKDRFPGLVARQHLFRR